VHQDGQHLGALPDYWRTAPDPDPPVQDGGTPVYEIEIAITGRPSIHNRMLMTDLDDPVWPGTAYSMINSIPAVVAAAPGFLADPVFAGWRPRVEGLSRTSG
jgi:hypothetical protein